MSGKIYIDVHPCGTFSSGMFWGDVQHYAATTPDGVTSYFAEAPNVSTEEIPNQLKVWRSHQTDERGSFNQWAAFCIQKWGVWFERVNADARKARIGRPVKPPQPIDALKAKILYLISDGQATAGLLRNRCRKWPDAQFSAALDELVAQGRLLESTRANESNGRTVKTYASI